MRRLAAQAASKSKSLDFNASLAAGAVAEEQGVFARLAERLRGLTEQFVHVTQPSEVLMAAGRKRLLPSLQAPVRWGGLARRRAV